MRRKPPDILITTPESLYLIMTSGAREILTGAEAVIVDEIHAVAQSKRGAHLALTLERLVATCVERKNGGGRDPPADRALGHPAAAGAVARFLVGPRRRCEIADAGKPKGARPRDRRPGRGHDRARRLRCEKRRDGGDPATARADPRPRRGAATRSIWPAIYPELLKLVREHTSTIIFVNNRRGAERLAKRLNELNAEEPPRSFRPPSTRATPTADRWR